VPTRNEADGMEEMAVFYIDAGHSLRSTLTAVSLFHSDSFHDGDVRISSRRAHR
jgi:hypothetical protein